jgi:protoporphyrinogen/coproporphyrinogen III oxidase
VRNVWVIGGGISGLACLYRLRQLDVPARLLEKSLVTGGMIRTVRRSSFLFEPGPQSFLLTETLRKFIGEIGLEDDLVLANPNAPRYVLRNHRLHAVPMGPSALFRSSLLGFNAKAKLISEPFRRLQKLSPEESVADFVRRKFGGEILDYLVAPFVSGVYAGDPETLSMVSAFPSALKWEREYGSVIRGAVKSKKTSGPRPVLASFQNGMAMLPDRLAEKLGDAITRNANSTTSIQALSALTNPAAATASAAHALVMATPAYVAANLLPNACAGLAELLAGIPYAPVATVAMVFHRQQVGHPLDGFGFLAPRKEGVRTLGTVWNSSLFPGRAPEEMAVITSFIGGATDLAAAKEDDRKLLDIVVRENSEILEIGGPPVENALFRYDRALPQYNIGHSERVAAINDALGNLPGLFLTGNYLSGPSIGDCVEHAYATAEAVNKFLRTEK